MANLPKEILAEKESVEKALNNLTDAIARPEKSIIELSAMATFLHNIYNGIEKYSEAGIENKRHRTPQIRNMA